MAHGDWESDTILAWLSGTDQGGTSPSMLRSEGPKDELEKFVPIAKDLGIETPRGLPVPINLHLLLYDLARTEIEMRLIDIRGTARLTVLIAAIITGAVLREAIVLNFRAAPNSDTVNRTNTALSEVL